MPGLGRRPDPDPNDARFLIRRALPPPEHPVPMPMLKTWRFRYAPLDQGETGTCVGHTGKYFLMCEPLACSASKPPSAFELYDLSCSLDEYEDNDNDTERQMGSSARGLAKALQSLGHIKQYLWAFDMDSLTRWLRLKGPIMFGSNWYSSMFNPTPEGIVKITPTAKIVGGHEYLFNRIDMRRGMIRGPQSWGQDFGQNGHVWYPLELVERLLREDGDALTALEERLLPKKGTEPPVHVTAMLETRQKEEDRG